MSVFGNVFGNVYGDVFGADAGIYPLESQVLNGVVFGASGEFTGNVVLPADIAVVDSVSYGPSSGTTGRWHPALAEEIISTASFGIDAGATGEVVIPTESQVITGVNFGPASELSGNVVLPAVSDVQLAVAFGSSSGSTGTLVLPTEAQVEDSVGFGAGGTEFTGTLTGGGGATLTQIVDAILGGDQSPIVVNSGQITAGESIHVSKTGNDSNNGTFASPKLTITAALTAAVSGQTVRVLDGIYDERNLLRDGVTLDFAPGSGVSYTGADGAVFDDGAGALSARVTGHGQLAHAGSGAIQDLIRATNGSQIEVTCESAESGLVVLRNQSASFIRFAANSAIAGDGLIDSLDADAVTFVKLGTAVSSSYICEMDGGYMSVEADSLTSTGQMVVECVDGHIAISGADMTSAAGEVTVNNSGTVSLVECNLLSDDGTHKVTSFGIFNATNCNVLESEVLLLGGGSKTIIPNLEPLATEADATTNRDTVVTAVEAISPESQYNPFG